LKKIKKFGIVKTSPLAGVRRVIVFFFIPARPCLKKAGRDKKGNKIDRLQICLTNGVICGIVIYKLNSKQYEKSN